MCVPTLLKIFRPITRNTLIFLFGLTAFEECPKPWGHNLRAFAPNSTYTMKGSKKDTALGWKFILSLYVMISCMGQSFQDYSWIQDFEADFP